MKIIDVAWFTEMGSLKIIGIVIVEAHQGVKKAYIGTAEGLDEEQDAQHIAKNGAKVHANHLIPFLEKLI